MAYILTFFFNSLCMGSLKNLKFHNFKNEPFKFHSIPYYYIIKKKWMNIFVSHIIIYSAVMFLSPYFSHLFEKKYLTIIEKRVFAYLNEWLLNIEVEGYKKGLSHTLNAIIVRHKIIYIRVTSKGNGWGNLLPATYLLSHS